MLKNNFYVADTATLIGEVQVDKNANIWFNAVIRVDSGKMHIGENTNIQDNAVLHSTLKHPISIGKNSSIGHNATLNGGKIGDNTLIGINATILDNTVIGNNCIVGANTFLPKNSIIPDNSVVYGVPGRIVRKITQDESKEHLENIDYYLKIAKEFLSK